MLMSFPELSKPRESRCIGKDKPFFLLNFRLVGYPECSGLDAKLVKWSRASYWQWCVDLALSAPGSQLVSAHERDVWCLHRQRWCCAMSSSPISLPILLVNLLLILFFFFLIFRFEGRKCLCLWNVLHGEHSQGSFSMMAPVRPKQSHPGRWQRWDSWGHWLAPASPGVSRL